MAKKLRELINKRICLIGGTGFIGSHLAEKLSQKNQVVIIGRNKPSDLKLFFENNKNIQFQQIDILSEKLLRFLKKEDFDIIIHLAGSALVWPSLKDPLQDFILNAQTTLRILDCLSRKDKEKDQPGQKPLFVYTSTIAVYGVMKNRITETDLPDPLSPYGASKLCADIYTRLYSNLGDHPEDNKRLNTLVLRYASAFGPRQKKLFIYDLIDKHHQSILDRSPVIIKGDGRQRRDFNYISNQVRGTIAALEHSPFKGEVINIGSGEAYPIIEVAQKISRFFPGCGKIKRTMEKRKGDAPNLSYDISKIKQYDYVPKTSLERGLLHTTRWYKKTKLAEKSCSFSIIIPTYNEKDNAPKIINRLSKFLPEITTEFEIIIVDDSSPDGTAEIVRKMQKNNPHIKLIINEKKKGLGYAHKIGLDQASGEILCTMDADGSPDIKTLIDFIYGIGQGIDLMIGSRYTHCSAIKGQALKKQLASKAMNIFIRYVLNTKLNDNTHSYRAISREAYQKVRPYLKDNNHPEFTLEMTHYARKLGLSVVEAPTTFTERDVGDTKIPILKSGWRIFYKILDLLLR